MLRTTALKSTYKKQYEHANSHIHYWAKLTYKRQSPYYGDTNRYTEEKKKHEQQKTYVSWKKKIFYFLFWNLQTEPNNNNNHSLATMRMPRVVAE